MSDSFTIRELEDADSAELARVLADGFPRHSLEFWQDRIRLISQRGHPAGTPKLGYGLDVDGLQGAILTIGSLHGNDEGQQTIINLSSWTVRPAFRGAPAKALYAHASSSSGVTFSNLSAAANTLKTITGLGFEERTAGQVIGIGVRQAKGTVRRVVPVNDAERSGLSPQRAEMMRYHERHGCIAFCIELDDRLAPLIFLPRRVNPGIPVAQLIYCELMSDFQENSRAVYLALLRKRFPALLVDASGPVDGLLGRYFSGKAAKYYKGRQPSYAVDHTYSEMIYIGF